MRALTVGSLFSGIGGIDLGLERAGMQVKWQCEISPYCSHVLRRHWPMTWVFKNVKTILKDKKFLSLPAVDLICGGFPCQPFSIAGKRLGDADDRDLWPQMFGVIRRLRPTFVLAENVPGFLSWKGGVLVERTYSDLENEGYEVAPPVIFPACALEAPHQRDRVWIVAHRISVRRDKGCIQRADEEWTQQTVGGSSAPVAHTSAARQGQGGQESGGEIRDQARGKESDRRGDVVPNSYKELHDWSRVARPQRIPKLANLGQWCVEPSVGRVAYGVPNRVDRISALGNAVVPQCAELLGRMILESLETLA